MLTNERLAEIAKTDPDPEKREMAKEVMGHREWSAHINQALNEGDGVYRP